MQELKLQMYRLFGRKMMLVLIGSLLLNLFLLGLSFFFWNEMGSYLLKECRYRPQIKKRSIEATKSLEDAVYTMKSNSFDELIALLEDDSFIHDGYTVRDISVSLLASEHHFNILKALHGHLSPKQERQLKLSTGVSLRLFPGLQAAQFITLIQFAKTEKYPYTTEGLFYKLGLDRSNYEVQQAFFLTDECSLVERLLSRGTVISQQEVIDLIISGSWQTFQKEVEILKKDVDLGVERRKAFLLSYLAQGSQQAAKLFVRFDPKSAIHKTKDEEVVTILTSLHDDPSVCKDYALAILKTPRKDEVHAVAKKALEAIPGGKELLQTTVEKKVEKKLQVKVEPSVKQEKKQPVVKEIKELLYTIQTGDSLWSICKKFHVDLNELKRLNNLQSDALKPGKTLHIPQKK